MFLLSSHVVTIATQLTLLPSPPPPTGDACSWGTGLQPPQLRLLCTVGMELAPAWCCHVSPSRKVHKPLVETFSSPGQREKFHILSFSKVIVRALRTLITLNGPDKPHLEPPLTSLGPGALFKLNNWPLVLSYAGRVLVW